MTDRRGIERKLHFACNREVDLMTNADYRAMASEIRDVIPLLIHHQTVADLRLLADRYDRLAEYLEMVPGTLPEIPLECRRQAG
jgi:hypothetical protein